MKTDFFWLLIFLFVFSCSQVDKEKKHVSEDEKQEKKHTIDDFVTERSGRDVRIMFLNSDELQGTHFNDVDSVRYSKSKKELIRYINGHSDIHHGAISRTILVDFTGPQRKNHEKTHSPLIYKVERSEPVTNDGEEGASDDEITVYEYDKPYKCDSIYDYGSKVVGYFNNQTITLDSFEKDVEVRIYVELDTVRTKQPK